LWISQVVFEEFEPFGKKEGWTCVSIWAVALRVLHGVYQFSATILDSEILLIVYCDLLLMVDIRFGFL
jgi:hypothetical protein